MANPTGYMDKETAESEKRHQEYMAWLKNAQAESREIHKNFQASMDGLAAETRDRHKAFVASNRAYANTLGKFDANREAVGAMKY